MNFCRLEFTFYQFAYAQAPFPLGNYWPRLIYSCKLPKHITTQMEVNTKADPQTFTKPPVRFRFNHYFYPFLLNILLASLMCSLNMTLEHLHHKAPSYNSLCPCTYKVIWFLFSYAFYFVLHIYFCAILTLFQQIWDEHGQTCWFISYQIIQPSVSGALY